jgi:hypothetical protein
MKVCLNLQLTVKRRLFERETNKPKSVAQFSIIYVFFSTALSLAIIRRTLISGGEVKEK